MEKTKGERNATIDYIKFISAVLVVFLHTANAIQTTSAISLETRKAFLNAVWIVNPVEFFVLVSCFFFIKATFDFQKKKFRASYFKKVIKRYVILYLSWSVLYLPNILGAAFGGGLIWKDALEIIRKIFVTGTTGVFWYMLGIIYTILIIKILLEKLQDYQVFAIACCLFVVSLLGGSYYHLLDHFKVLQKGVDICLKITAHFYILRVPVFMMIAYYLAKYRIDCKIRQIGWKKKSAIVSLYILAVLAQNYEKSFAISNHLGREYPAFILGIAVSTLLFCISMMLSTGENNFSRFLGQGSAVIYYSHWQTRTVIAHINGDVYDWKMMIIAITIGLCLTMILRMIKEKKQSKIIDYLI